MYNVCIILVSVKDFLTQLSELRILADYQSMKLLITMMRAYRLSAKKSQNGSIICISGSKNPTKKRNIFVNLVKSSLSIWLRTIKKK
jgi:hypothetical protein